MKKNPLTGDERSSVFTRIIAAAILTISAAMATDRLCPPVQIVPLQVGTLEATATRFAEKAKTFDQSNIARFLKNGKQAKTDLYSLWEIQKDKKTGVTSPVRPIYIISPEVDGTAYYSLMEMYQSTDTIRVKRVQPSEVACQPGSYVVYATGEPRLPKS